MRRMRSPRCCESPGYWWPLAGVAARRRRRRVTVRRGAGAVLTLPVSPPPPLVCGADEAEAVRPVVDWVEVVPAAADPGRANPAAATSAIAPAAGFARSRRGYDKKNPFSFSRLRG